MFTTVLDELTRGTEEEDEAAVATDRSYWENRGSVETVALADELLALVRSFAPGVELKFNKFYIGLAEAGQPNNFAIFRAKKQNIRAEIRLRQSDEVQQMLDAAELDVMDYEKRWGRYRIRLTRKEIAKHKEVLTRLMRMARDRAEE